MNTLRDYHAAFELATELQIGINLGVSEATLKDINSAVTHLLGREIFICANETSDVIKNDDGNYITISDNADRIDDQQSKIYGIFRGFCLLKNTITSKQVTNDDILEIDYATVAAVVRDPTRKSLIHIAPVEKIKDIIDIRVETDNNEALLEIEYLLSQEDVKLLDISKQIEKLKCDDVLMAAALTLLHCRAKPTDVCSSVTGLTFSSEIKDQELHTDIITYPYQTNVSDDHTWDVIGINGMTVMALTRKYNNQFGPVNVTAIFENRSGLCGYTRP